MYDEIRTFSGSNGVEQLITVPIDSILIKMYALLVKVILTEVIISYRYNHRLLAFYHV